jgi:ABC-type glycerol-3-phosphate transport system substrate-binding protein
MHKQIATSLLILLLVAGCSIRTGFDGNDAFSASDQDGNTGTESTLQPGSSPTAFAAIIEPISLVIWVPDDFAIKSNDQAQKLLVDRLKTFEQANTGISIDIRFKNVKNQENMMELLNTTSRVAPSILPDIVLLSRNDMETAALKGLLIPLDAETAVNPFPQTFPGFEALGKVQGSTFGLPAAGDVLVILSRDVGEGIVSTWQEILDSDSVLGANLNDPNGTFFLALYQSTGGKFTDEKGKPFLDQDALTKLLVLVREAKTKGAIMSWSLLVSDWMEVSSRIESGEGDLEVNWFSYSNRTANDQVNYYAIPGLADNPASLLTGWYWTSANPAPERQAATKELLSFLSQPVFASTWSSTAGYLPVSNQMWPVNDYDMTTLQEIMNKAQPVPETSIMITVGPVIRDSAIRAFSTKDDIEEIVISALARINQ